MAYSPDGIIICTGGEDGKLKLWNATSGFCYVTMEKSHTAPITAVAFANASVVLSASLDGTVRAHDLHRYRTFKTLTTPTPVQFLSLAVDPSGEIVTAGTADPYHIYVWNLQSGKILDVFTGHTGPICDLAFQSTGGTLASASWDGTVKTWDLYKGNVPTESLQHSTDVVCVAIRPDGKEICTGSIGGLLTFWDVEAAKLKYEIDGRRDIAGGRKVNDRMTADNNASSRYFTSVCYSADGSCVLAGGNSKYVCIYEVSQQMLLKKFQVTFNRSLDGVLDEVRFEPDWCFSKHGTVTRKNARMMNFPINVCSKR
jgi:periodic tryptophan protein 2